MLTNDKGTTTYQAQYLKQYDEAKSYFVKHCGSDYSKRIFHFSDSVARVNVLNLIELVFFLPVWLREYSLK